MLSPLIIEEVVKSALKEDLGHGYDITSEVTVPTNAVVKAAIVAREDGILAGLIVALSAFSLTSPDFDMVVHASDGDAIQKDQIIAEIEGPARDILAAERTALNFISHMSGVASLTNAYVQEIQGTGAEICDTRKTLPGLRAFQKYAVHVGGGSNHRSGLDDAILIKDNHIAIAGGIPEALQSASMTAPHTRTIEIEVETLDQLQKVVAFCATNPGTIKTVMLDNMEVKTLNKAVKICSGKVLTEASGGITLQNVKDIAQTGVHFISVGALTHSAPALDMGLDISL